MEALVEAGVGIEAGVWTVEDAERLGAEGRDRGALMGPLCPGSR